MKTTTLIVAGALSAAALSIAGGFAVAENHEMDGMAGMEGMADGEMVTMSNGMTMPAMAPMSDEGMQPFMAPMDTMMATMPMTSTGMPDADFLLMMIPHHQSAIDMAKVELEMGQDEETRAIAQRVVDSQEAEIAEMRAVLEGMGVEPPAMAAE